MNSTNGFHKGPVAEAAGVWACEEIVTPRVLSNLRRPDRDNFAGLTLAFLTVFAFGVFVGYLGTR